MGQWDVTTATYTGKSVSVSSHGTGYYTGVNFKTDGTKMYITRQAFFDGGGTIYPYTLSTAWDISTATYDGAGLTLDSQTLHPHDLFLTSDGLNLFVLADSPARAYPYTLSTAWDVTTATYDGTPYGISQEGNPQGFFFKPDGTKMYVVGVNNDTIYAYTLSTAWDVTTATYDTVSKSVSAEDTAPLGLFFKPDGFKMYVVGNTNDTIYPYTLSTAWDISTATYDGAGKSVSAQDSAPDGIDMNGDGTSLYIVGDSNDAVYQYEIIGGFTPKMIFYS